MVMSISRPTLNHDILLEVMKACARSDCARFMRTSQFFYQHGFGALLAHPIYLIREGALLELLAYLRKGLTGRFKYVRSLHFAFYDGLSEATALELVTLLPLMTRLEELHISRSEYFLDLHPDLSATISALTSVRYLTLRDMGDLAMEMLQLFRSELVTVYLDLLIIDSESTFDDDPSARNPWLRYNSTTLLSHSEATLEEIYINCWYKFPTIQPERTLAFPKMRRLVLLEPLLPPRSETYIRTYPNLSELVFRADNKNTFRRRYPRARIDTVRTRNISKQVELGTWDSLRAYKGSLFDLYILGLTCRIDQIHLRDAHSGECDQWLGPVLSYARPVELKLPDWPGKLHDPDVSAAFRGQGCSRLERLDMEGMLWASINDDVDVAAVLENLLSILSASAPLRDLRMQIDTTHLDPRPSDVKFSEFMERYDSLGSASDSSPPPMPPVHRDLETHPLTFAEESTDNFDPEDYVRRFTTAVPSLQRVEFTLRGPRCRQRSVTLIEGELLLDEDW